MKRQLLAGRFGPDDLFDVTAGADEQRTYLQLVAGEKSLDHGIGGALTVVVHLAQMLSPAPTNVNAREG